MYFINAIIDIIDNTISNNPVVLDFPVCGKSVSASLSNDILLCMTGGTVGKSYLVKDVPEDAVYAGYLIRTRYSLLLCPEFLKYFKDNINKILQ